MNGTALHILNGLIELIERIQEPSNASNTLGGNIDYYYQQFGLNEQNEILLHALNEYDNCKLPGGTQKANELESKYIFAFFARHYQQKAAHIVNNESHLNEYILKEVLTAQLRCKLDGNARKLLNEIQSAAGDRENKNIHAQCYEWTLEDTLLVVLGRWFNDEFFSWFKPKCTRCPESTDSMQYTQMMTRKDIDQQYGPHTSRVHIFRCTKCQQEQFFQRFYSCDSAIRHEQYRMGWCGEHCDVFAALVNVLGYKWRFALDDTDHIWLEIYSAKRQKWCCFEPSPEQHLDRYDYPQKFATRQSRYIIAIDGTPYQDITATYQTNVQILQQRRATHVMSEKWVEDFLNAENADY